MITFEDVIKALEVLKEYCEQVKECEDCSLCIDEKCQIKTYDKFPSDWKIKKEKVEL